MAKQRQISMNEFAIAMLKADRSFADRTWLFNLRFGNLDPAVTAVLAQAAYFCWFGCESRHNLISTCRAIGRGEPTTLQLCLQISPERWDELHAYVVGIQQWFGDERPVPSRVDAERVRQVKRWLGERTPGREGLAVLLLDHLLGQLTRRVSLSQLNGDPADGQRAGDYEDYSDWYVLPDGTVYSGEREDNYIDRLKEQVRQDLRYMPQEAEELISRIHQPPDAVQPVCMHRFTRYLDIKLASISALEWRGNLPANGMGRIEWRSFVNEAHVALNDWLDGLQPRGRLAEQLHEALGEPDVQRKSLVRDFLLAERSGTPAYFEWLEEEMRQAPQVAS